jgi:hypothetical protein
MGRSLLAPNKVSQRARDNQLRHSALKLGHIKAFARCHGVSGIYIHEGCSNFSCMSGVLLLFGKAIMHRRSVGS